VARMTSADGACLVQKRQRPPLLSEPRGGLSDQSPQGSGEMGLIVESGLVDGVADGDPPLEKGRRIPGSLDLPVGEVGDAGRLKEVPLCGTPGERLPVPRESGAHGGISREHPDLEEPGDQRFRVLEAGIFPGAALEPERPARYAGEVYIPSIGERRRRVEGEEGAQREADAEPLAARGAVNGRGPGLRPAERHNGRSPVAGDDHLAVTRGYGQEAARTLAVAAPDPLDQRRIRRPVLEHQEPVATHGGLSGKQWSVPGLRRLSTQTLRSAHAAYNASKEVQ